MIQWTERMYQFLRNNYQRMEDKDIAAFLTKVYGVKFNVRMIEHARARLGLIKYRLNTGTKDESSVADEVSAAWEKAKEEGD